MQASKELWILNVLFFFNFSKAFPKILLIKGSLLHEPIWKFPSSCETTQFFIFLFVFYLNNWKCCEWNWVEKILQWISIARASLLKNRLTLQNGNILTSMTTANWNLACCTPPRKQSASLHSMSGSLINNFTALQPWETKKADYFINTYKTSFLENTSFIFHKNFVMTIIDMVRPLT